MKKTAPLQDVLLEALQDPDLDPNQAERGPVTQIIKKACDDLSKICLAGTFHVTCALTKNAQMKCRIPLEREFNQEALVELRRQLRMTDELDGAKDLPTMREVFLRKLQLLEEFGRCTMELYHLGHFAYHLNDEVLVVRPEDTVELVREKLEAQQKQLEEWQQAVSDARSKHHLLNSCTVRDLCFLTELLPNVDKDSEWNKVWQLLQRVCLEADEQRTRDQILTQLEGDLALLRSSSGEPDREVKLLNAMGAMLGQLSERAPPPVRPLQAESEEPKDQGAQSPSVTSPASASALYVQFLCSYLLEADKLRSAEVALPAPAQAKSDLVQGILTMPAAAWAKIHEAFKDPLSGKDPWFGKTLPQAGAPPIGRRQGQRFFATWPRVLTWVDIRKASQQDLAQFARDVGVDPEGDVVENLRQSSKVLILGADEELHISRKDSRPLAVTTEAAETPKIEVGARSSWTSRHFLCLEVLAKNKDVQIRFCTWVNQHLSILYECLKAVKFMQIRPDKWMNSGSERPWGCGMFIALAFMKGARPGMEVDLRPQVQPFAQAVRQWSDKEAVTLTIWHATRDQIPKYMEAPAARHAPHGQNLQDELVSLAIAASRHPDTGTRALAALRQVLDGGAMAPAVHPSAAPREQIVSREARHQQEIEVAERAADQQEEAAISAAASTKKDTPTAPAPASDQEYVGQVKSISAKNGHGFITCSETESAYGRDVFVDAALLPEIEVKAKVSFTVELSEEGHPRASKVTKIADAES